MVLQRCDTGEERDGWRTVVFGSRAEEHYLRAKADEAEKDRGKLVLFKFCDMELFQEPQSEKWYGHVQAFCQLHHVQVKSVPNGMIFRG